MHFPDPCGIHPQVDRVTASAANTRAQPSSRPEEDLSGMLLIRKFAARYEPYLLSKCERLHSRVVKSLTEAMPALMRAATTAGSREKLGRLGLCHARHMTGKGLTERCRAVYAEFFHCRAECTGGAPQILSRTLLAANNPPRLAQHFFDVHSFRSAQID